jgi:hypothetical protein
MNGLIAVAKQWRQRTQIYAPVVEVLNRPPPK